MAHTMARTVAHVVHTVGNCGTHITHTVAHVVHCFLTLGREIGPDDFFKHTYMHIIYKQPLYVTIMHLLSKLIKKSLEKPLCGKIGN